MKKSTFLISCAVLMTLLSFTQVQTTSKEIQWTPPAKVILADSMDYEKYADDVISCKTWMETNPFTEKDENWKNASQFMLQWVTGSPSFTMVIYPFVMDYTSKKNKSFLVVFMTGAAANAVQHKYTSSDKDNFVAGFQLINKVYTNAAKKKKDKNILELIKLEKEGKLTDWVEAQMTSAK